MLHESRRADARVAAAVVSGDVSAAVCAVRAISLACASFALVFWFRNDGIAIAARMPMIRITTRSSIRVKPFSSWARRRSLESMDPPGIGNWVVASSVGSRPSAGGDSYEPMVVARLPPDSEVRGFASRPHERFAFGTETLGGGWIGGFEPELDTGGRLFDRTSSVPHANGAVPQARPVGIDLVSRGLPGAGGAA